MAKTKQVQVKLVRSMIGRLKNHKSCVRGLGLSKIHQTNIVDATPCNMGMINKVSYLLEVQEV